MIAIVAGLLLVTGDLHSQEPFLTLQPDLFARTVPELHPYTIGSVPGPILYPEITNLNLNVSLTAKPSVNGKLYRKLLYAASDQNSRYEDLMIGIWHLRDGAQREEYKVDRKALQLRLDSLVSPDTSTISFNLVIPTPTDKTVDGQYLLDFGIWYEEGTVKKTVGAAPFPFEVRKFKQGGDDEVNLLSNVWINKPHNLVVELIRQKRYDANEISSKVLELKPNDVWVRHEAAKRYLRNGREPEKAKGLYQEILKLVENEKAERLASLLDPYAGHSYEGLEDKEAAINKVKQLIANADATTQFIREAEATAKSNYSTGGSTKLIQMIATDSGQVIWQKENGWETIWAIRLLGEKKSTGAHSQLVKELSKLQPVSAQLQTEICNALAEIHDNDKSINVNTMTLEEGRDVIDWWTARPNPSDVNR